MEIDITWKYSFSEDEYWGEELHRNPELCAELVKIFGAERFIKIFTGYRDGAVIDHQVFVTKDHFAIKAEIYQICDAEANFPICVRFKIAEKRDVNKKTPKNINLKVSTWGLSFERKSGCILEGIDNRMRFLPTIRLKDDRKNNPTIAAMSDGMYVSAHLTE